MYCILYTLNYFDEIDEKMTKARGVLFAKDLHEAVDKIDGFYGDSYDDISFKFINDFEVLEVPEEVYHAIKKLD